MTLDEIGVRLESARGKIDRIYCHWTGAPYQLVECLAYHVVIDRGGYCHVIHEDFTECLAHTWHRNSRSIGVALACCRDACCYYDAPSGVDLGREPPTEAQIEALAMFCARAVEGLGLSVSDIYTHAEMAAFDGYGIGSGDPDMRWDLLYVPDYGDGGVGVTHQGLVDEVGADEAGASGDEDVHRTRSDEWELRAPGARHGRRHHATGLPGGPLGPRRARRGLQERRRPPCPSPASP